MSRPLPVQPRARKPRGGQAGISLVELLVAIIISAVVSMMLITGWINLQRSSLSAVRKDEALATARDALSRR